MAISDPEAEPVEPVRGILNPAAEGARFTVSRHAPDARLAAFVDWHWIVRWDLRGAPAHRQETLPHPSVHLAFETGRSAVHGVTTGRFSVLLEGAGRVVGTRFRPGAFVAFTAMPMSALRDRVAPIADVFGITRDGAEGLERAVLAEPDDAASIAVVTEMLVGRRPVVDPAVEEVAGIVASASTSRAITTVAALAAAAGTTERSLQRLFRRYVGVSPKWVIRRFRMHEAADRIATGTVLDWAALAMELGYADQAHFIRDFRAEVGYAPTKYAALCADARRGTRRDADMSAR